MLNRCYAIGAQLAVAPRDTHYRFDTMPPEHYQSLFLEMSAAANLDEIGAFCRLLGTKMGFEYFIYALRVPRQFTESRVVLLKGYPDAWLSHYWQNDYAGLDPVIRHCSRHVVPVLWHDLPDSPAKPAGRVMDEAREFGMKTGISMPVHSPQGSLGILSFATGIDDAEARAATRQLSPYVQLLAAHLHEAILRVSGCREEQQLTPQLTRRETECLRWAADGKTSWEIGQLLNMSERTVNFHFNNAAKKLSVVTRQHAVAKAILYGFINPLPF